MPVSSCPDCRGEFVDVSRLKIIEKRKEVQFDAEEAARLSRAKTGPTADAQLACPRCSSLMKKGRYPHTDVVVDHCESCSGLWLDDQELEKLQVLAEERELAPPAGGRKGIGTSEEAAEYRRLASSLRQARSEAPAMAPSPAGDDDEDGAEADTVPEGTARGMLVGLVVLMLIFVVLPFSLHTKTVLAYWLLIPVIAVIAGGVAQRDEELVELTEIDLSKLSPLETLFLAILALGALFAIVEFELWWHDKRTAYTVTEVWLLVLLVMAVAWLIAWASSRVSGDVATARRRISSMVKALIVWVCGYPVVWLIIGVLVLIEEGG